MDIWFVVILVFWQILDLIIDIHKIIINDKDNHVEHMEAAPNHVPSQSKLFPFVFYNFMNRIWIVNSNVAALITEVGETQIFIH